MKLWNPVPGSTCRSLGPLQDAVYSTSGRAVPWLHHSIRVEFLPRWFLEWSSYQLPACMPWNENRAAEVMEENKL